MRVLLAPSNVANQSTSIAAGLRARGHEVEIWNYGPSPNGFDVDRVIPDDRAPGTYQRTLTEALDRGFDVFHFHTARSLVPGHGGVPPMWDLPVLRAARARIVFTFHGSDVRLRSHHEADDQWSFYRFADIPCDEEKIAQRLAVIRTFAHQLSVGSVLDQVYAPDATYVPKSLVLSRYEEVGAVRRKRPVVLHATRRRATKGTDLIVEQVTALQAELDFEFRLVEGATHAELLDVMGDADVVIEKLLGGDAGVLSLEAMAMGKVAVARIRPEVLARHPSMPVVSADPETFAQALRPVLSDPGLRDQLGRRGRCYVEEHHDAALVAAQWEALYTAARPSGAPPHPDWAVDPSPRRLEAAYEKIARLEEKLRERESRSRRDNR
ncbi:glycosyltransferase family 4 protein [Cellulomonas sp. zg-ZUI22]|uniref:glycosyltransferase family 4 protein n=1 Tax=Cellulomonas sp. zg-ZUI22 TaxID=2816955 RepID=UPI001A93C5D6|nr:glycosyltransferase family 4 protein [Cellulomonas sp. zg-ZUI22]MBO0901203.1 glycosyltransferase family 4 protein [Cellulomonas sp. zg-ZUI22]